jgi:hypothetical protein
MRKELFLSEVKSNPWSSKLLNLPFVRTLVRSVLRIDKFHMRIFFPVNNGFLA